MDIGAETARAYAAFAAGRHSEAAGRARAILLREPHNPAALTLIGRLGLIWGDPEMAHDVFATVLARHPDNAALWLDQSAALRDLGRHREALESAGRATDLDAARPDGWIRIGEIRLSLNEREQAAAAFREALAREPDSVPALRGLSQAEDLDPASDVVRRMQALAASSSVGTAQSAALHYALAHICRRAGQDEGFITHLLTANAKQRSLSPDGRERYEALFDQLESVFTAQSLGQAPRADPIEPTPIFVLGMPRSGTTLVEQLLAAHPDVAAGGELDYMRRALRRTLERETNRPFPEGFERVSQTALNAMAQGFARRLRHIDSRSRFVTDKTPGNYHVLGLLRVLFPRAPIVHVVRDPMDTCFSILQYPFDDRSPHTCDMELLAYVYARYVRLMERWRELLGDQFITVEYERLVESPGEQARRLFAWCGLDWQDAYLDFHRSNTAVRTFSGNQVRRPIYTTSVGAWRKFSEALKPLEQALAKELSQHMGPARRA